MIKRISVLLLLLALSMTALFGCSQTKETKHASAIINTDKTNKEENLMPVTLNEVAHSIFYAPMYVAIEKGYFEGWEGVDVLENETNEVILNDEFMQKALSPLEKMLELAK